MYKIQKKKKREINQRWLLQFTAGFSFHFQSGWKISNDSDSIICSTNIKISISTEENEGSCAKLKKFHLLTLLFIWAYRTTDNDKGAGVEKEKNY